MPPQHDIRLVDVFHDLWAGRKAILIGLVFGLVCASVFLLLANPHYKARMIVAPAKPMNGTEMSSLMADDNLFALRYIIQNVGVSKSSDFLNFENIYFGPSVADALLKDEKLRQGLALDRGFVFSGEEREWNASKLSEYLRDRVTLSPLGSGGLRVMQYYHVNPDFALYLLQQIHSVTDQLIREKIRAQATERVGYLNNAIARTGNPEHRKTLTTLLLEQERLLMLVSIDQPYAASVVEPPSASAKAMWPDAALLLSALGLLGGFLGFMIHSLIHHIPVSRQTASPGTATRLNRWYKDEPSNSQRPSSSSQAAE